MAFVVSDRHGRQVVWDLLSHCGVFTASFDKDPLRMAFNEGKRHVGIWLLRHIESEHPGSYALMQSEHHDRELRYEAIAEPDLEDENE